MDRELRVTEDGYELAELKYAYETPVSGRVHIKINRIYELSDDMKSTYPIHEYESYFSHRAISSIAELKDYDKELLKKESEFAAHLGNTLEYLYEPLEYRYVVSLRDVVGIAQIKADFNEKLKEVQFLSGRRMKEDISMQADIFEPNKLLLARMCEEYLGCYGADFTLVGWN